MKMIGELLWLNFKKIEQDLNERVSFDKKGKKKDHLSFHQCET